MGYVLRCLSDEWNCLLYLDFSTLSFSWIISSFSRLIPLLNLGRDANSFLEWFEIMDNYKSIVDQSFAIVR